MPTKDELLQAFLVSPNDLEVLRQFNEKHLTSCHQGREDRETLTTVVCITNLSLFFIKLFSRTHEVWVGTSGRTALCTVW